MKVALIDLETTGDDPELDVPIEVSIIFMNGKKKVSTWGSLLHPGHRPISPVASACHHITLRTFETASHLQQLTEPEWWAMLKDSDYLVAHNASFDSQFIPIDTPWICTYRCARHIWPDAPKFSLQALRYWLDIARDVRGQAHRAHYDTQCLQALWLEMRKKHSVDELLQLTTKPVLIKICGFGKHRGTPWEEVPKDYLKWIMRQDFDDDTLYTAEYYLNKA